MAKAGSGEYSFFELPTKPQTTLLFLVLLVLFVVPPVLFARPCAELSKTSMAVPSSSAAVRHVLLSAQQSSSSVEFDPNYKQAATNKNLTKKHFEASAHEVPSGPNPDSNKCLTDIDLLWSPGGWIIDISNNIIFMAKVGSGGYSFFELPTKLQATLLFLVLLLLVVTDPVLFARPCAELSKISMAASSSSSSARRALLSAQQQFHPKQAGNNKNLTKKQQFEASAHEVPTGPNPDSNK